MISVLVVDDEKLIRDTLRHYVDWSALGVDTVLDACDGNQALDMIRTNPPDIVIADIKMPHMDGIQLAKIVREQYSQIRFLFLSGYADKEYLKEAIHLHIDAFIEKPLNLNEISGSVRTLALECRRAKEATDPVRLFFRGSFSDQPMNNRVYTLSNANLQGLGLALKGDDKEAAILAAQSFCAEIRNCEGTEPEYIRNVFFQAAMQLRSAAEYHHAYSAEEDTDRFSQTLFHVDRLENLEKELLRITEMLYTVGDRVDLSPVDLVDKYLQKNFTDSTLSISKIAQDLNFNASYLCTIYKQRTGRTINRVLTDIRLQQACTYLETSDLQLKEITSLVGYSNGKYFTKIFMKEYGVSPKEYRRLHHA